MNDEEIPAQWSQRLTERIQYGLNGIRAFEARREASPQELAAATGIRTLPATA
jgi:hypothetical protein